MIERKVVVRLADGLHARPATQFVKLARGFASNLTVLKADKNADAKSAVKLMLLGVKQNEEIVLRAEGADEAKALAELGDFVSGAEGPNAADETLVGPVAAPTVQRSAAYDDGLHGVAASEGVALGPAFAFFPKIAVSPKLSISPENVPREILRVEEATFSVRAELAKRAGGNEGGEIAKALEELALDPELQRRAHARLIAGENGVSAILQAADSLADEFEGLSDPYLRARGDDVRAVAQSIALTLLGERPATLADAPPGSVVVAEEINALELIGAPMGGLAGLVSRKGGATSHVAIIARSRGLPAVLGLDADVARLRGAREVAVDGSSGVVILDPAGEPRQRFLMRIKEAEIENSSLRAWAHAEPRTRDGRAIQLAANIGSLNDVPAAVSAGAMGVGLFRTELLFMQRRRPPTEDEQVAVYAEVARAFAPHPVIVRTLDVGGDKKTPGIVVPHEENPFLGWRGVRLTLDRVDIFKPQLRALLRASTEGNIKVMIPMIATVEEIRAVKRLLEDCRTELRVEGRGFGDFDLGIMVETPAAVFVAEELAKEVAFFSIGTNDLTQYIMAADRHNEKVAPLNRPDNQAVLRAVAMVCAAARNAGIWVGVCGEAAARPDLIETFVSLGVTELSMSATALPRAKKCVASI